ncbi:hypothetical protein JTB14_000083 [Gonioctena quinquepunctata]|nr:hypothetical protein JTB14_000083 [Gonioctena quinquepunctata]
MYNSIPSIIKKLSIGAFKEAVAALLEIDEFHIPLNLLPKKSSSGEESKSEVENTTEQKEVIEIKKGIEVEEPENRPSKEALPPPPLEQHEDEYFVHLSNAESDDELDNQQKSEQFMNTERSSRK